jgi:hypothetical protein
MWSKYNEPRRWKFRPSREALERIYRERHDKMVGKILEDPTLLNRGGICLDPKKIRYKTDEKVFGSRRNGTGRRVDLAFLSEPEPYVAEITIVEASFNPSGTSKGVSAEAMRRLLKYIDDDMPGFLRQLREKMGFDSRMYKELWLDMLHAYYGGCGAVGAERLRGFDRKMIAKIS